MAKKLTMDRAIVVAKDINYQLKTIVVRHEEFVEQLSDLHLKGIEAARIDAVVNLMKEDVKLMANIIERLSDIVTLGLPDNWRTMAESNGIHIPDDE